MTDLQFIIDRLPPDHPYTDDQITAELVANGNNKYLALASLWERLGSADRYTSVSAGNLSYSGPLCFERARYWRGFANDPEPITGGTITFVPATGLFGLPASPADEYSG